MVFSGDPNFDRINAMMRERALRLGKLLYEKFQQAGKTFIDKITREQMSGRRGERGLNVRSNMLRTGWRTDTTQSGQSITNRVFTEVPYARIHQFGGDIHQHPREQMLHFRRMRNGGVRFSKEGKARFAQKVAVGERTIHIPKRLYVIEDYQETGVKLYLQATRDALREAKSQ